jgi:S-adenosylmethionine hydrolase
VPGGSPDTIFFLSDYGLRDGFVGVVHAVLRRLAPHAAVVDLTHELAPFDVRAGAAALARAVPHLGASGVVLAVVDPGGGGARRAVVVEAGPGPLWLVGPDNGLLIPAADLLGVAGVYELPTPDRTEPGASRTFDGRDVLGPAAAALCMGKSGGSLGTEIGANTLVRLPAPVVEHLRLPDGRPLLRAEVTWVDRFGNVQLAAAPGDLPRGDEGAAEAETAGAERGDAPTPPATSNSSPASAPEWVSVAVESEAPGGEAIGPVSARCVGTFADLEPGELGVIADSDGHLALVAREDSASARLGALSGDLVDLVW